MYEIIGSNTCDYCQKAKEILEELGIGYNFKLLGTDLTREEMRELVYKATGEYPQTLPQIFRMSDDEYIGGYEELADHLLEEGYTYVHKT